MVHPWNTQLAANAKVLRKNMTKEERWLWYNFLRHCRPRFRRQEIIGNYIADFYCDKAKLVIELDGSQHMDPAGLAYDSNRTEYFQSQNISVVRCFNTDIQRNFNSVCQNIPEILESKGIHPSVTFGDSSPQREP